MTASTTDLETAIREAADERAIQHVLSRYSRAIDRFDMELLRTVYHPDAYDDHGGYKGDVEGFVAYLNEVLPRFEATQHFLGNTHVELDGDVAHTETYCQALHRLAGTAEAPPADSVTGLRYVDRFERRDGEWRIARRQIVIDWSRTDPVVGGPSERSADTEYGRRDRSDPVYHFGRGD